MGHMVGSNIEFGYVDKRHAAQAGSKGDAFTHLTTGPTVFTANGAGTTTTMVGANAAPATGTNVARLSDQYRLFASGGALKEETVFSVSSIAVAGSTTITFTPAAAVATASGDFFKLVGMNDIDDEASLDARLAVIGTDTANNPYRNQNDKGYAVRLYDDPGGF